MKKVIILGCLFLVSVLSAQSSYEKGMGKAFELWQSNNIMEAQNVFERIANAEKNKWLPHYYVAQINSILSWSEKDETVLKAQLDKAQLHLDKAFLIEKENAELLVLQAHVLTNWVAFDGMRFGPKYSQEISMLYEKAYQLDSKNPRVLFSKAEWDMGSARFFGKDTAPYCKTISESIPLFDTFKPESKMHPNWGKERAVQVAKNCK